MSAVLKPAAQPAMLSVAGVDTFHGETQALFNVSLEVGAGRGGRAARAQWRRQDHHAAHHPRA